MRKPPLGFMSSTGALLGGAMLVGVVAWSGFFGLAPFSPGPLGAATKGATYGGVSSHAQLDRNCGACHVVPFSRQTMAERCLGCHTEVTAQLSSDSGVHGPMLASLSVVTCRGCHTDHHGRSADLTVTDAATFPHDLTGYSLQSHRRTARGARLGCAECHPQGLGRFDQQVCLKCHQGLDATFMAQHVARFGTSCLLCHHGIDSGGSDFDHNKLPFKLIGKHAGVACDRCHTDATATRALRQTPQGCFACHADRDAHQGRFGQQCEGCHTPFGWGNANFDHSVFPINHGNGGQASACTTCHPNGLSTYTCFGCHRHTPSNILGSHEGRSLAQITDCVRCHRGGNGGGD